MTFKEGDVLLYPISLGTGIALVGEYLGGEAFDLVAWYADGWHRADERPDPWTIKRNQIAGYHPEPDKIWAEYAAWRLCKGD